MSRFRSRLSGHKATLRWVSAGQIDAGFAALSGFVAGIFAIRILDPTALGGYTLLFASFSVASQFPAQLVFSPAEVIALRTEEAARTAHLRWSVAIGGPMAAIAASSVLVGAWPVRNEVPAEQLTVLSITAVLFAAVSPIQDHVRRMLHLSGKSERAAATSLIQFVATLTSVFVLQAFDPLLVPFGAPTIGNTISTMAGVWFASPRRFPRKERPPLGDLFSIGGYLLYIGLSTSGARYISNTVVASVAGSATLGLVESARIIARPADVVATGLYAVVNPRSMGHAADRNHSGAKQLRRLFVVSLALIMGGYLAIASVPFGWSPLPAIAPTAYEVPWLVAAVIVSFFIGNLATPYFAELMGARLQRQLAKVEIVAQSIQVGLSFLAAAIGPFAVPVAHAVSTAYKGVVYRRRSEAYFQGANQTDAS